MHEQGPLTIQQVFANVVENAAREMLSKEERLHALRLAKHKENIEKQVQTPRIDLNRDVKAGYPAFKGKDGFEVATVDLQHIKSKPYTPKQSTLEDFMKLFMADPDLKSWEASQACIMKKIEIADADENENDDAVPTASATEDDLSVLKAATTEA